MPTRTAATSEADADEFGWFLASTPRSVRPALEETMARHTTRIGTAFVPVSDPERASRWYEATFGFRRRVVNGSSAWLETPGGGASLTLMGPDSGIAASPGLDWASCNLIVDDLDDVHRRLTDTGAAPSAIDGDPDICRFFTLHDPDGNQVLVVDR